MMKIQSITDVEYTFDIDGIHAILRMNIDGKIADIDYVQKLLDSHGFVFLGSEFYDDTYIVLPANPEDSLYTPTKLGGYTNDSRIAQYVLDFRAEIDSGNYKPRQIT